MSIGTKYPNKKYLNFLWEVNSDGCTVLNTVCMKPYHLQFCENKVPKI